MTMIVCLIVSPFASLVTHGPGAWVAAVSEVADDIAHGHSHGAPDGQGAHDPTDHDHQTAELLPAVAVDVFGTPRSDRVITARRAEGRGRDRHLRPPRRMA